MKTADRDGSLSTDIAEIQRRLEAAQGDTQELALITLDFVLADQDPGVRDAIEAAAVPHWFDARILGALLGVDAAEGEALAGQLAQLTAVEPFQAHSGWNVHEATRLGLRRRLAREQPDRFADLSTRAMSAFEGDQPADRIERIYHHLMVTPGDAGRELARLWLEWDRASLVEPLDALGTVLSELLRTDYLAPFARARALLCLGWIRLGRLSIGELERTADESAAILRELGDEEGLSDALHMKARALVSRGSLETAGELFESVRRILERLLEGRPGDTALLSDLANVRADLGALWRTRGRFPEAEADLAAGLDLRRELAAAEPASTRWQYELAVSRIQFGQHLTDVDDLDGALRELDEAIGIFDRLLADQPDSPDWQREQAVAHNAAGIVLRARGDLAGSARHLEASRRIVEQLTQDDPEHMSWRLDLQVSHALIGSLLAVQGRVDAAAEHYGTSLQIAQELVAIDPDNAGWWDNLASAHSDLGDAYRDLGRLEDALKHNRAARAIAFDLVDREPAVGSRRANLATACAMVGGTLRSIGRLDDALSEYGIALATMQELTDQEPENVNWQSQLASLHQAVGGVLDLQGRPDDALREYETSRAVTERLAERKPGNSTWQMGLAIANGLLGRMHKDQGRLSEALQHYRDAKEIIEKLASSSPDNTSWQRQLSIAHGDLGLITMRFVAIAQSGEVEGLPEPEQLLDMAFSEFGAASKIMDRLTRLDPDNTSWRQALASCLNDMGEAFSSLADRIDQKGGLEGLPPAAIVREKALEQYRTSQAIMAALCQLDPANTGWQRLLSIAHYRTGHVLRNMGLMRDALQEYEADLAIAERLAAFDPTNAHWRNDLQTTRDAIADFRKSIDVDSFMVEGRTYGSEKASENGDATAT